MKFWNEDFKEALRDWGDNLSAHLHIGGKETGPANIRVSGDEKKARQLAATLGRKLLAEAKMRAMAQGLATALHELSLVDGSKIRVQSQLGTDGFPDHDSITTYVPEGGKAGGKRCIGYIIQTFQDHPWGSYGPGDLLPNDTPSFIDLLTPSGKTMNTFSFDMRVDFWDEAFENYLPFDGYPDNGAKYLAARDFDTGLFGTEYQGVVVSDYNNIENVSGAPVNYVITCADKSITNSNWEYVTEYTYSEGTCGNSGCDWYWEDSNKYWAETADPCIQQVSIYAIHEGGDNPLISSFSDPSRVTFYTGPHRMMMPVQCFMDYSVSCYRADREGVDSEGDVATPDTGPYGLINGHPSGASQQPNPDMNATKESAMNAASAESFSWFAANRINNTYQYYNTSVQSQPGSLYSINYISKRTDGKGGFHSQSGFYWDKGDIVFAKRHSTINGESSFFMLPMGTKRILRYSDEIVNNTIYEDSNTSSFEEGGASLYVPMNHLCYQIGISETNLPNMTLAWTGKTSIQGKFAIPNKVEEGIHQVRVFYGEENRLKIHLLIQDEKGAVYFESIKKDCTLKLVSETLLMTDMTFKIKVGEFKDIGELVTVVE